MNLLTLIVIMLTAIIAPQPPQTHDIGLIGHFDGPCPEGWEEYKPLVGRVPVGAGNYIGTAEDGRTEAVSYSLEEKGGEVKHGLTIPEVPEHNHINGVYKYIMMSDGRYTIRKSDYSPHEVNLANRGEMLSAGGNKPHNNMQPHLVLTPCKKITDPKLGKLIEDVNNLKENQKVLSNKFEEFKDNHIIKLEESIQENNQNFLLLTEQTNNFMEKQTEINDKLSTVLDAIFSVNDPLLPGSASSQKIDQEGYIVKEEV